jgi:hypothetical protein
MLNAPSIFWGAWKMVQPFIDPVTRQKLVFLSASELHVLHQEVGVEVCTSTATTPASWIRGVHSCLVSFVLVEHLLYVHGGWRREH